MKNNFDLVPELSDKESAYRMFDAQRKNNFIELMAHSNISSVTCMAPVWNSTDWVNSTLPLEIKGKFWKKYDFPFADCLYFL